MSGSMGSGDRMRANFATETEEDRDERNHIMNNALWLALPNIIVAIFAYYMWKKRLNRKDVADFG